MPKNNSDKEFNAKDYFFAILWVIGIIVGLFSISPFYKAVQKWGSFSDSDIFYLILFPIAIAVVILVLYFGMSSLVKVARRNVIFRSIKSKITEALEYVLYKLQPPSKQHRDLIKHILDTDSFNEDAELNAFEWKRRLFSFASAHQKHIEAMKIFICDNQGWLANYLFEISEGHRSMKDKLRCLEQMKQESQTMSVEIGAMRGNRARVRESKNELNGKLADLTISIQALTSELIKESKDFHDSSLRKFQDICEKNYHHLVRLLFVESSKKEQSKYAEGKTKLPRMTIKGFNSATYEVYDLCRMPRFSPTYEGVKDTNDNSAFDHIHNSGTHFICNDIPKMASEFDTSPFGNKTTNYRYMNPRLINEAVRNYNEYLTKNEKNDDDEKWITCWGEMETEKNGNKKMMKPSINACYRSTLVIPITLLNNAGISDAFKNHFGIPLFYGGKEKHRAIWGVFCLDHIDRNYFIEEIDVPLGYCFADILSLYHIGRLTYTEYSSTFKTISELDRNIINNA